MLADGDVGMLTFQGTRFNGFERVKSVIIIYKQNPESWTLFHRIQGSGFIVKRTIRYSLLVFLF